MSLVCEIAKNFSVIPNALKAILSPVLKLRRDTAPLDAGNVVRLMSIRSDWPAARPSRHDRCLRECAECANLSVRAPGRDRRR